MLDWFSFSNFYSFLYIIFILVGLGYISNYINGTTTDNTCTTDETCEDDCLTIEMKRTDLDKTISSIKKLEKNIKNLL